MPAYNTIAYQENFASALFIAQRGAAMAKMPSELILRRAVVLVMDMPGRSVLVDMAKRVVQSGILVK